MIKHNALKRIDSKHVQRKRPWRNISPRSQNSMKNKNHTPPPSLPPHAPRRALGLIAERIGARRSRARHGRRGRGRAACPVGRTRRARGRRRERVRAGSARHHQRAVGRGARIAGRAGLADGRAGGSDRARRACDWRGRETRARKAGGAERAIAGAAADRVGSARRLGRTRKHREVAQAKFRV